MNKSLQLRPWFWFPYLGSACFWLIPLWAVYFAVTKFAFIQSHPIKYLQLFAVLFASFALPYTFGNLVVEIESNTGFLKFTTFGKLPFVPYGPIAQVIQVPSTSQFEWHRPTLFVLTPDSIEYRFSPAIPIRKKTLTSWFHENGLPSFHNR